MAEYTSEHKRLAQDVVRDMRAVETWLRSRMEKVAAQASSLESMIVTEFEDDNETFHPGVWASALSRVTTNTIDELLHCSNVHHESLIRHATEACYEFGRVLP